MTRTIGSRGGQDLATGLHRDRVLVMARDWAVAYDRVCNDMVLVSLVREGIGTRAERRRVGESDVLNGPFRTNPMDPLIVRLPQFHRVWIDGQLVVLNPDMDRDWASVGTGSLAFMRSGWGMGRPPYFGFPPAPLARDRSCWNRGSFRRLRTRDRPQLDGTVASRDRLREEREGVRRGGRGARSRWPPSQGRSRSPARALRRAPRVAPPRPARRRVPCKGQKTRRCGRRADRRGGRLRPAGWRLRTPAAPSRTGPA